MDKTEILRLQEIYQGHFKYALAGFQDKPVAIVPEYPAMVLGSILDSGAIVTAHTDRSGLQMLSGKVEYELYSDDISITEKYSTDNEGKKIYEGRYICAKYDSIDAAVKAMEKFPSSQITLSVFFTTTDEFTGNSTQGKHADEFSEESKIKFYRGWLLVDPSNIKKVSKDFGPAVLEWNDYGDLYDFMISMGWKRALYNFDRNKMFSWNGPKDFLVINPNIVRKYESQASGIFRGLEQFCIQRMHADDNNDNKKIATNTADAALFARINRLNAEMDSFWRKINNEIDRQ